MTEEIRDCYRLLRLDLGATPRAARHAYRRLMKMWHPDRFANDAMTQKLATEKSKAINDAYQRLTAFLSGTCTESPSLAESVAAEEAGMRAAKEAKAQEEAVGRAKRAAEARAREETIRRAAEARAREQARLKEEVRRRAEEQARQAQARLKALSYDDGATLLLEGISSVSVKKARLGKWQAALSFVPGASIFLKTRNIKTLVA